MANDNMKIRGLYAIIDNSVRPDVPGVEIAKKILAGGAKVIQLRGKGLSSKDLLAESLKIRKLAKQAEALFIVNDRSDIALLSDADGVHLGQDDLPVSAARKVLGKGKLIGISTHSLEQAIKAEAEGADYIGFGPVFGTKTKADAEEAKGLDALLDMKKNVKIPVVAIGGIDLDNIKDVVKTGADSVAVISAIAKADDIKKATERLREVFT